MDFDWLGPKWVGIIKGIQFVIGLQLLGISILLLVFNNRSKLPLALICYIVGEYFFKRIFWDYWPDFDLLILICGGRKEIFLFPLMYFLVVQLSRQITYREVLKHIIIPAVFYLTYVLSRIFFKDFYENYSNFIREPYVAVVIILIVFYFRKIKQLLPDLKQNILPKAFSKYYILFVTLFVYYFFSALSDAFSIIVNFYLVTWQIDGTVTVSDTVQNIYDFHQNVFWPFVLYIQTPIHYMLALGLFLFALSELPFVKKYFLPKNIEQKVTQNLKDENFKTQFELLFKEQKVFKKSSFKIEDCALLMSCSINELTQFIKKEYNLNFASLINNYRIEDFKINILKPENEIYDIVSVAVISGFKSKATFYRVFKAKEGITPHEYKQKINF